MRKRWIFLIGCIFLVACGEKTPEIPIESDKLVKILVDVHLAESAMQDMPSLIRDSMGKVYYEQIFEIHNVRESEFNQSMRVIKGDPVLLDQTYKKVQEELERQTLE